MNTALKLAFAPADWILQWPVRIYNEPGSHMYSRRYNLQSVTYFLLSILEYDAQKSMKIRSFFCFQMRKKAMSKLKIDRSLCSDGPYQPLLSSYLESYTGPASVDSRCE